MYLKNKAFFKLKRFLLPILFVTILTISSFAQISVGARLGVNLNQFTMPGTTIGATAGAFGTYKVTPFVAARLEILYSQEGGGLRDYFLPLSGDDPLLPDATVNVASVDYINPYVYIHTLQVPVLAELTLPEFDEASVQPVLLLGASYNYMFRADELHTTRYTFKDGTFANIPYGREDVTSGYKASQLSAIGGMGLKFKSEKRDFYFDIRYRQGLNQLNNVKQSLTYKDGRLYSSSLSFSFSMTILKF